MTDSDDGKAREKPKTWLEKLGILWGREPKNRDQLIKVLRDAQKRELLSADMSNMIERILQVSEMQVRDVMIPKAQMISVHNNDKLDDVLPIIGESGHSRFPVFDSKNKEILGILLAKDLLRYCFNKEVTNFNIADLIRTAMFTPQSKRLDVLLREFRSNRNHIAIVLDEYGRIAGLITIEDVLEQIVGEIEDEYDIEEDGTQIRKHNESTYIVKATTLIEEFNEYFNTLFSDEEFDTIGGIVLHGFGHLPKRGESVRIKNFRFKVLHSDNRRLYLLEVKVVKAKKKEEL